MQPVNQVLSHSACSATVVPPCARRHRHKPELRAYLQTNQSSTCQTSLQPAHQLCGSSRRSMCTATMPTDSSPSTSTHRNSDTPAHSTSNNTTSSSIAADIVLSGSETPQEVLAILQQCISQGVTLGPSHMAALETALTPASLTALPANDLVALLKALVGGCSEPPSAAWISATLNHISDRVRSQLSDDDMPQLSSLTWAVLELGAMPDASFLEAVANRMVGGIEAGSFLAKDLADLLCALGSFGFKPPQTMTAVIIKESQFQLKEFLNDFSASDVARLASGLADLGLGTSAWTPELNTRLMKAVYTKVRTIEDKAAVDFALAKLNSDERSMHYDPRWTHEELSWLPRRERDKRRMMKEFYVKSQWGGWGSSG